MVLARTLIRQLRSVDEGVFDGAVMGVETTAAIEGGSQFRSDPMAMTGFYSYGEICPSAPKANCALHNQTMTITTFSE